MLLSVLVLGVCGLPYGAALHVGVDHEKDENQLPSPDDKLDEVFYTLDESSGFWIFLDTIWRDVAEPIMQIRYRGDRAGWGSVDHAFDVKLDPEGSYADAGKGYSVMFRDTDMNEMGFGEHFYQKFAILPQGESDKKKALFTVRMDPPNVHIGGSIRADGAKKWKIFKGFGSGASSSTWREILCLPQVRVVPKDFPRIIPRYAVREGEMYVWIPKVPHRCSWNLPITSDNKGSTSPMSVDFFNGLQNSFDSDVLVEENWDKADDPKGIWKSAPADKETALFLTIATVLEEVFKVGGSGN